MVVGTNFDKVEFWKVLKPFFKNACAIFVGERIIFLVGFSSMIWVSPTLTTSSLP
jgi:hypothetical protein